MSVAIEEMNEKGCEFTMDDLANRLGVSKKALYKNFSSKEQLIDEIIDLFLDNVMEKESQIINNEKLSTMEKIRELALVVENELKYVNERTIYEAEKYYPKQWKKIEVWLKERQINLKKIIQDGIKKGELVGLKKNLYFCKKVVQRGQARTCNSKEL